LKTTHLHHSALGYINMDLIRRHEGHTEVKTDQYWAFGYYFETLNDAQKHQRREYLDWYGFVAQWSVLVIFVLFQVAFAVEWMVGSGLKYEQPKSPSFTKSPSGKLGWLRKLRSTFTNMKWWLGQDVLRGWNWGMRGEWIGASVWTVWLLYLCVANTGKGKMNTHGIVTNDANNDSRLSTPYEAIWTNWCVPTTSALPSSYESAILPSPMAHTMFS
jgi:hypothetical protein